VSFAGYDSQCDDVARGLLASGVQRGDRVFAMLRNGAEFMLLAVACGRAGAIFVPVNTELKGFSLQHQLHNCAPRIVVTDADLFAQFAGVAAPAIGPSCVVVVGDDGAVSLPAALEGAQVMDFKALRAPSGDVALHEPAPHEIAC